MLGFKLIHVSKRGPRAACHIKSCLCIRRSNIRKFHLPARLSAMISQGRGGIGYYTPTIIYRLIPKLEGTKSLIRVSNRSEICQASARLPKRQTKSIWSESRCNFQLRGFETLRNLIINCVVAYWNAPKVRNHSMLFWKIDTYRKLGGTIFL